MRPSPVPPGGTLGIFAGSGPFDPADLQAGIEILEAQGFRIARARGLDARLGFLAGSDDVRVAGLEDLLSRTDVDGLMAARGGYGLTRILHRLDPELWKRAQRPLVGFSDVSALHAFTQSHGLESFHGPVVTQLPRLPAADHAALARALHQQGPVTIEAAGPVLVPGRADGLLWGGNLAVLTALVGTEHLRPPERDGLLLLEDVGEQTYRLDRLLTQLRRAGVLDGVVGVALGDFERCRPGSPGHPTALEVLEERLEGLGVPVLAGFPIGHGTRNVTVPFGRRASLDTGRRRLEIDG